MNSTPRFAIVAACGAAAAVLGACSTTPSATPPSVPAAIAVPTGNKVAFTYKGSGLLNYECRARADAPGGFDWALVAPDAALRDQKDALVGKYYGGPTWEHADGSKVSGRQVAVAPAPTAGNIPWQVVQATPTTGTGTMSGITYIQRINTVAGVAPAESCSSASAGTMKQVRYSADYVFYRS